MSLYVNETLRINCAAPQKHMHRTWRRESVRTPVVRSPNPYFIKFQIPPLLDTGIFPLSSDTGKSRAWCFSGKPQTLPTTSRSFHTTFSSSSSHTTGKVVVVVVVVVLTVCGRVPVDTTPGPAPVCRALKTHPISSSPRR